MDLLITILGLAGFGMVMWDFSLRLPEARRAPLHRWFRDWAIKGLLAPVLLWILFSSGLSRWSPLADFAQLNGLKSNSFKYSLTLGLFVIGTYWTAVTVAWVMVILWRQAEDHKRFRSCVLRWSALLLPLASSLPLAYGWRLAGLAATLWLIPVLQQVLALKEEDFVPPVYARAIAAIQFDKYEDAEKAVLAELEACEDDFEGWLMLADLYANHFNDIPGAEKIIRETCENPRVNASQIAVAFHRLADWRLKLGRDPDGARAALVEISRRLPNSHLDRMARLRINNLPATREALIAAETVRKIHLPVGRRNLGLSPAPQPPVPDAAIRCQLCIEQLNKDPDDIAARETLARLYAEELGRLDLGLEQLSLLLRMLQTPRSKSAEWMGLMAFWHLREPQGQAAAREVMERIIRTYPDTPQAFTAKQRLNLMNVEDKMRQAAGARLEHAPH